MNTDMTSPHDQLADLERRIFDGDTSITAATLQKAKAAAELADLHATAERRRAELDADAARQAAEDAFRSELAAQASRFSHVQNLYSAAVDALRAFSEGINGWENERRVFAQRGKALGLVDVVDTTLIALTGKDWVDAAYAEARARYERGAPGVGGKLGKIRHHALRSPAVRERIDHDDQAEATARAERRAARDAEKAAQREADAAFRAQFQREATDRV